MDPVIFCRKYGKAMTSVSLRIEKYSKVLMSIYKYLVNYIYDNDSIL